MVPTATVAAGYKDFLSLSSAAQFCFLSLSDNFGVVKVSMPT